MQPGARRAATEKSFQVDRDRFRRRRKVVIMVMIIILINFDLMIINDVILCNRNNKRGGCFLTLGFLFDLRGEVS